MSKRGFALSLCGVLMLYYLIIALCISQLLRVWITSLQCLQSSECCSVAWNLHRPDISDDGTTSRRRPLPPHRRRHPWVGYIGGGACEAVSWQVERMAIAAADRTWYCTRRRASSLPEASDSTPRFAQARGQYFMFTISFIIIFIFMFYFIIFFLFQGLAVHADEDATVSSWNSNPSWMNITRPIGFSNINSNLWFVFTWSVILWFVSLGECVMRRN